jgi:hypothetical protein
MMTQQVNSPNILYIHSYDTGLNDPDGLSPREPTQVVT